MLASDHDKDLDLLPKRGDVNERPSILWLITALALAGLTIGIIRHEMKRTGDPGGAILAQLTPVETFLPNDAHVVSQDASEPHWDSCDGRDAGWSLATVIVQFTSTLPPDQVMGHVAQAAASHGWAYTEDAATNLQTWTKALPGVQGAGTFQVSEFQGMWDLSARAAPPGFVLSC